MTVTVATLADRVLRRLGVSIVPVAGRPPLNTRMSPASVATNALIELGVIATGVVPPTQATIVPLDTIATLALTKLGVIASDETPLATDMTLAQNAVNAVHTNLVAQGNADWTSAAITTAVAEEYAGLTAFHLASSFGKAADPAVLALLEERVATVARVIRAQNLALSKVQEIQASLTSQGVVSWDDTGIPMALAEEYTRLTAMSLASSFGQKVDPAMVAVWEKRVREVAMLMRAPNDAQEAVMSVHDDLVARGVARWSVFDIPTPVEGPYVVKAANLLGPAFSVPFDQAAEMLAERSLMRLIALPSSGEQVRAEYF